MAPAWSAGVCARCNWCWVWVKASHTFGTWEGTLLTMATIEGHFHASLTSHCLGRGLRHLPNPSPTHLLRHLWVLLLCLGQRG